MFSRTFPGRTSPFTCWEPNGSLNWRKKQQENLECFWCPGSKGQHARSIQNMRKCWYGFWFRWGKKQQTSRHIHFQRRSKIPLNMQAQLSIGLPLTFGILLPPNFTTIRGHQAGEKKSTKNNFDNFDKTKHHHFFSNDFLLKIHPVLFPKNVPFQALHIFQFKPLGCRSQKLFRKVVSFRDLEPMVLWKLVVLAFGHFHAPWRWKRDGRLVWGLQQAGWVLPGWPRWWF